MTGTREAVLHRDAVGDRPHRAEPRGLTVGALRPVPHSREAEDQDHVKSANARLTSFGSETSSPA